MFFPTLPAIAGYLGEVISHVCDFSTENDDHPIDSMIILLLLETPGFSIPISGEERETFIQKNKKDEWKVVDQKPV